MNDLEGRARRVGGMFVAMIGAGLLLESGAWWTGLATFLAGAALFAAGFARRGETPGSNLPGDDERRGSPPSPPRQPEPSDPWTLDPARPPDGIRAGWNGSAAPGSYTEASW